MEAELIQGLEEIGYTGELVDPKKMKEAISFGPKTPLFTTLVSWLATEISSFGGFDETVHPTSSPEDANSFLMELGSFLKELGCLNQKLTSGNINSRLTSVEDRLVLLEYLIAELMASKITESKKRPGNKQLEITVGESITAKNLKDLLLNLRVPKPPDDISAQALFGKINSKAAEIVRKVPKELIGKPLFFGELRSDQWEKLDKLQADLNEEYTIRRELLIKRLDVTVNSFAWSERVRPRENELQRCFNPKRDAMKKEPDVNIATLLAAREDLAIIEKTSSASVRKNTRSQVNKVIIGAVPDRGGRPCEQEPPPPEMPPWQKDRVQGPPGFSGGRGGGGRGGGGGGGGGRGGGGGGGGGGRGNYQDHKSASSNFGQNYSQNYSGGYNQSPQNFTYGGYNQRPVTGGPTKVFYRTKDDDRDRNDSKRGRGDRVQGGWNQGGGQRGNRY